MPQPRKLQDKYFKLAKSEGYAARSAYKLQQIDDRKHILRRGDVVLDLGCAPGSWTQVAAERITPRQGSSTTTKAGTPRGVVVGIDLLPIQIEVPSNARCIIADVFKVSAAQLAALLAGGDHEAAARAVESSAGAPDPAAPPFNVLLSDMAPNTEGGGGGSADHFRSVHLCRRVLQLCTSLLKPGGNLVMKVFEGESYAELVRETAHVFEEAKGYKPEASREVSREMFVVAKNYRPRSTKSAPAEARAAASASQSPTVAAKPDAHAGAASE